MPILGSGNNVYGGIYQAVASGSIANGKACVINENGTVSQAAPVAGGALLVQRTDRIYGFYLTSPFDTSATTSGTYTQANSASAYFDSYYTNGGTGQLAANTNVMHAFNWNADGSKLFALDFTNTTANSAVREFTSDPAYDITALTYVDGYVIGNKANAPRGMDFKTDGTEMYIVENDNSNVWQWTLSTGFDVSTASYTRVFDTARSDACSGIRFKPDGTKMFIHEQGNDTVDQYSLSTAWDISSASYDSVALDISSYQTGAGDINFNADGTKFYVVGDSHNDITEYALSTAYALNTASFTHDTDLYHSGWAGVGFMPAGNAQTKNYVGISVGAVSNGQTASIRVLGGIDTNQSGLTPNAYCYVQNSGAISSTTSGCVAGWALSPTTVLIKGNYAEILLLGE
tara:strand:- start:1157 stop:2362 length:1206 start_codon:yes stop_codon:yes gene_type:complete